MAVHKWLNAKSIPTLARMPFIAKKLDVSVEYLLADVTTDKNNKNIKLINKYQALSPNKQKIISDLIDELL
jgi:transcriptional regulator with XRE-family HTH domain